MSNYRHTPRTHLGPFSSQLYLRTISPAPRLDVSPLKSSTPILGITAELLTSDSGQGTLEMETIGSSETTSLAEEHTTITVLDGEPTTITVLDGNHSLEPNNNQETLLDPARLEDNSPNNATTEEATEPSPVVETPSGIPVDSAPFTNSPMETQTPMPVENGVQNGQVSRGAPTLANGLRPGAKKFASLAKSVRILNRAAAKTQDNMHSVGVLQAQTEFLTKFGMGLPHLHAHSSQESGIKWEGNKMKFIKDKLVFDSNEDYYFHWLIVVSLAVMYNLFFIVFRCVFTPSMAMLGKFPFVCINLVLLVCDIFCDGIYLIDMFVKSRTGFMEQGILVRDVKKITKLYFKSWQARIDILSILPLDYLFEIVLLDWHPYFRFLRLLQLPRLWSFISKTETRISTPNAFRVCCVVGYIIVLIHWNACLYYFMSDKIGIGSDGWVYGYQNTQSLSSFTNTSVDTFHRRYIYSLYWATLILVTIAEVNPPQTNVEYIVVTINLLCGVLIFATIVGNVGSMISNTGAARAEFQMRIDSIKQFMKLRKISKQLETRVIKWFDYLWANKQSLADEQVLSILPDKLQAEIAMHVHFETLRKVRIFQDCEAGLLAELVLKLQLQVFSPMDYVCRKGDIGKEMYIVKKGKLQVVSDDGLKVFAMLQEGSVFGELSILNIPGSKQGNRRSASIRSVGYTDLFVLNKTDLWEALREYPEAKKLLIQKGREILKKDNLLDENAPKENKSPEEFCEELQGVLKTLQTRLARLTAEHVNNETKLLSRIDYLEEQLRKCERRAKERSIMDLPADLVRSISGYDSPNREISNDYFRNARKLVQNDFTDEERESLQDAT